MNPEGTAATDLLDDLDKVLEHLLSATLVGDDGCGQVAKDVGTHGLNGIQVPRRNTTHPDYANNTQNTIKHDTAIFTEHIQTVQASK